MNIDSFCYAVLLKRRARAAELLSLLPVDIRDEVRARMDELQTLPEAEARSRWRRLRADEARELRVRAARSGVDLMLLPPRMRALTDQHAEQLK